MRALIIVSVLFIDFFVGGVFGYILSNRVSNEAMQVFTDFENEEIQQQSIEEFNKGSADAAIVAQQLLIEFIERRKDAKWVDVDYSNRVIGMAQARLAAIYLIDRKKDVSDKYAEMALFNLHKTSFGINNANDLNNLVQRLVDERIGHSETRGHQDQADREIVRE